MLFALLSLACAGRSQKDKLCCKQGIVRRSSKTNAAGNSARPKLFPPQLQVTRLDARSKFSSTGSRSGARARLPHRIMTRADSSMKKACPFDVDPLESMLLSPEPTESMQEAVESSANLRLALRAVSMAAQLSNNILLNQNQPLITPYFQNQATNKNAKELSRKLRVTRAEEHIQEHIRRHFGTAFWDGTPQEALTSTFHQIDNLLEVSFDRAIENGKAACRNANDILRSAPEDERPAETLRRQRKEHARARLKAFLRDRTFFRDVAYSLVHGQTNIAAIRRLRALAQVSTELNDLVEHADALAKRASKMLRDINDLHKQLIHNEERDIMTDIADFEAAFVSWNSRRLD